MELIGYHGTNQEYGNQIIREQKMHASTREDEWLGKGVYFFWDKNDAIWWCHKKHIESAFLIHANIHCENVLDLVHDRECQEEFSKYCQLVKDKSDRMTNGKTRRNYMSLAIKLLMKRSHIKIEVSIGNFPENRQFWNPIERLHEDKFPILVGQVQICVYDEKCIASLGEE